MVIKHKTNVYFVYGGNLFMKFLSMLLAAWGPGTNYADRAAYLEAAGFPWLENLLAAIEGIIGPILIVIGAVGIIYAIYLGVMLAKAENAEKREEAKKRIINVVIAIAITAVLIFLMYLFSNNIDWFINLKDKTVDGGEALIGLLR